MCLCTVVRRNIFWQSRSAVRRRTPLKQLLCIQPPCDAVELDISTRDLAFCVDSQQIEAFDFILARADIREKPVPHDLVAGVEDVESLNARVWVGENFTQPLKVMGKGVSMSKARKDTAQMTTRFYVRLHVTITWFKSSSRLLVYVLARGWLQRECCQANSLVRSIY